MTSNILSIDALAARDDSIIKKEFYPYAPYTQTYGANDEIRIAIQSKDSYLLPCESYLYLKLTATTTGTHGDNDTAVTFVENFASFLFSEVRYELNGVTVDSLRNVGRASTMKLNAASRGSHLNAYFKYCKAARGTSAMGTNTARTKIFDVVLPLSVWFGFLDDYQKIIPNAKHELVLTVARSSLDCCKNGGTLATAATVNIVINQILWKMPHITLSDRMKLNMLNYLSRSRKIVVQHRSMEMFEYPQLPTSRSNIWAVKTVSHLSRPRYVIFGFQTDRKDVRVADASVFDICHATDVRLHLNSQTYPYNMSDLDIGGGVCAQLYNAYVSIQSSYYNNTEIANFFNMTYTEFQKNPLFVFDTSRADESLINSAVDIKLEIRTRDDIPANTAAYCLVIYESEFTYSPFDGIVVRSV